MLKRGALVAALVVAAADGHAIAGSCGTEAGPRIDWSGCSKPRLMLTDINFAASNFEGANLTGTDFRGSTLDGSGFYKSDISRVSFRGSSLNGANFEKAELGRADFSGAVLTGARFAYANLSRADLSKARFEGGLDLSHTFLFLTRIEGLDLSASSGLEQEQVDLACGNAATKLPPGFTAPPTWPCAFD